MANAHVTVERATGTKCLRCWRVLIEVGRIWRNPDICWRCNGAMDALEARAIADNTTSGDWQTDPAAFHAVWRLPFENHPIRALALDESVPKLLRRAGKRIVSKTMLPGDDILEVWGTETQMPWVAPPPATTP